MRVHEASYGFRPEDIDYLNGARLTTSEPQEGLRPQDFFTNEERAQIDNDDVIYHFNRLTVQEELPPEEEIARAQALIHAIEKVQKNLDNLI